MPDFHTRVPAVSTVEGASPSLWFHKWQRYDSFLGGNEFKTEDTGRPYLGAIRRRVQEVGKRHYRGWKESFDKACSALEATTPIRWQTEWRLVVGWGTNPAWETGLNLHHLFGFPYVPGSAVKGLIHRMAELELGDRIDAPPQGGVANLESPPEGLDRDLTQALWIRTLFGALHLRPNPGQPPSALTHLEGWLEIARERADEEPNTGPWSQILPRLKQVCAPAPAGGMLTCFDAVPEVAMFASDEKEEDFLLQVDVLTPHSGGKNPILFLAVRPRAVFEIRYRLASWPDPGSADLTERLRAEGLGDRSPEKAGEDIERWLRWGLTHHGLGARTTAGYGYFRPPGAQLPVPLPAVEALDEYLDQPESPERTAFVQEFGRVYAETMESWDRLHADIFRRRLEAIRTAQAEEEGHDDP